MLKAYTIRPKIVEGGEKLHNVMVARASSVWHLGC